MTSLTTAQQVDPIASSAELQRALGVALQEQAFATFKWCLAQCSADVTEAPEFHLTAPAHRDQQSDWRAFGAAVARPLFAAPQARQVSTSTTNLLDQQWLDALHPQPLLGAEAALPIPLQVWQNLDVHSRRRLAPRQFAKATAHESQSSESAAQAMGWQASDLGDLAAASATILN